MKVLSIVLLAFVLLISCAPITPSQQKMSLKTEASQVKTSDKENIAADRKRSPQAPVPETGLPNLPIKKSVDIFSYASKLRNECMLLFSYTGVILRQTHGDVISTFQQNVKENGNDAVYKLKGIQSKSTEIAEGNFDRPLLVFNSSEEFLLDMEQSIRDCNHSIVKMIDSVINNDFLIGESGLSESDRIARAESFLFPQLRALLMTYTFEAAEYEGFDTWLSAQHRFVLLMQHIYQTLIVVTEGHLNIKEMPDKDYFSNALVMYSTLKENSVREVTMLSGMSLLLRLAERETEGSTSKISSSGLQSDTERLLSEFDQAYSLLLMELSKNTIDYEVVNSVLLEAIKETMVHEVSRTEYRKKYMMELINMIQAAVKQKNI